MMPGVEYLGIDDAGLRVRIPSASPAAGAPESDPAHEERIIEVDTVVLCTGQEPARELHGELAELGIGAHLIGPRVSDLIAELVVAMEFKASAEDLARTVHAHPTLAEAVKEAALGLGTGAVHF